MSEQDDTARVHAAFDAQGLKPTTEEMAMYCFMAPVLRQMTDQIHAVEIGEEL